MAMWITFLVSLVFILFLANVRISTAEHRTTKEPGVDEIFYIMAKSSEKMTENPVSKLSYHDVLNNDEIQELDNSIACNICQLGLGFVQSSLALGLTYPQVRPLLIESCITFLGAISGWHGEIMCPGLLDHNIPPFFYMMGSRPINVSYACETIHMCYPSFDNLTEIRRTRRPDTRETPDPKHLAGDTQRLNPLKIVQLTDIHFDHEYAIGAATDCGLYLCCRDKYEGNGSAGAYGAFTCSTPIRTVEFFLSEVRQMEPPPDFVLYTGDTPPHHMWEETQASHLNYSQYLADLFKDHLPGLQVYPTLGNHETYPSNLYYLPNPDIQELNSEFTKWWTALAEFEPEQIETMQRGGYYSKLVHPGLRVLAYNSLLPYDSNFYVLILDEEEEYDIMRNFMETTLNDARQAGEKVILIGHIPVSYTIDSFGYWFHDLVVEYNDVIVLQVYGHTHKDHFSLFRDRVDGRAVSVLNIVPSMTPLKDRNPTARVWYLDAQTFEVLEYEQYLLNLTEANASEDGPSLELSYRATEEYGMSDLSAASWGDFVERLEEDQELFDTYYYHHVTGTGHTCDEECKKRQLCEVVNPVNIEAVKCERTTV